MTPAADAPRSLVPNLLPQHHDLLAASGIAPAVAAARGYRSITTRADLAELGFNTVQRRVPALLIPIWNVDGRVALHQLRPDIPRRRDGKPIKYETAAGARMALDVPPSIRRHLPDPAIPLFITEGVRKADAAASQGLCCVDLLGVWNWRGTNAHGGKTELPDWDAIALNQRAVYLVFDSDVARNDHVRAALDRLTGMLTRRGGQVRTILLPPAPDGTKVGLDDYLAAGHGPADLLALAADRPAVSAGDRGGADATRLVNLVAQAGVELFHDPQNIAYATIPIDGHTATWPLDGRDFLTWLSHLAFQTYGRAPRSQALNDALIVLTGRARFVGPERPVHLRVAGTRGAIYLDLGNAAWEVVEITANGWRVCPNPPVTFRRPSGWMQELPTPVAGGSLDELRSLLNLRTEQDFALIVGWLVAALRPQGPYPLLALSGEQGSAKSTTARLLRSLVDPNLVALRGEPKDLRDLAIAADNNWILGFDNVSYLPPTLSDALCRVSTGGGFATRALYTNAEELVFDVQRPVLLTGIEDVATRGDLLDRSLIVSLPAIPPAKMKPETQLQNQIDAARPRLLGVLLDGVASAMARLSTTHLPELPRMADFCLWVEAAGPAFGWEPGSFWRTYAGNREASNELALEAHPIGPAILTLMHKTGQWEGTATDLLKALEAETDESVRHSRGWPRAANKLSGALNRLAPQLRAVGVEVVPGRRRNSGRQRMIELQRTAVWKGSDPAAERPAGIAASSPTQEPSSPVQPQSSPIVIASDVTFVEDRAQIEERRPRSDDGDDAAVIASPSFNPSFVARPSLVLSDGVKAPLEASPSSPNGDVVPPERARASDPVDDAAREDRHRIVPIVTCVATPLATPPVLVATIEELHAAAHVLQTARVIGLDLETTGLDPRHDAIRLVSLATSDGVYVVDVWSCAGWADVVGPILANTDVRTIIHNGKFDLAFLWRQGLVAGEVFDTLLAAQIVDSGQHFGVKGYFKLEPLARRALGILLDKTLQAADWAQPTLSDQHVRYAGNDAAVLLPLADALSKQLVVAGLAPTMAIESAALPALVWLEDAGVPLDGEQWRQLGETADAEMRRLAAEIGADLGPSINLNSAPQLKQALRALGIELESTSEAALAAVRTRHPVIDAILAYKQAAKRARTFGPKVLEHVDPDTGRIHADYQQIGAATGRMACREPNLQNIPRDAMYRSCICPHAGRVLVKADYSQIELRIVAQISGDERMIAAFQRGEDLHQVTARAILGRDPVGEDRQLAKAVNFGLLYGMGPEGLQSHAQNHYGIALPLRDAVAVREKFFTTYPGLRAWQGRHGHRAMETRTLTGRRRGQVEKFTEQLNSPVQGTGADIMKGALGRLWADRAAAPSAVPILVVHDEIVLEVDAADAPRACAWVKNHMVAAGAAILPDVPVTVEATIVRDWSGAPAE